MPAFSLPGSGRRNSTVILATLLILVGLHTAATWGRVDAFIWRDVGRWLHEVERFAAGELPYRDFSWQFPPLSIWILGLTARFVGTSVGAFWAVTAVLYALICLTYLRYVTRIVWPAAVFPVLTIGLICSAAFANFESAPLPLGMYMPAAPLGFLFLLATTLAALRSIESGDRAGALGTGFFAALAILTKQDFWIPAFYLLAASLFMSARRPGTGKTAAAMAMGVFALTILAASAAVALTAGWRALPRIVGGYGSAAVFVGRGLPSWERLTTEISVLSALGVAVCLTLRAAGAGGPKLRLAFVLLLLAAAASTFGNLFMDYRSAAPVSVTSFAGLSLDAGRLQESWHRVVEQSTLHLLPLILPFAVTLIVLWRWKHFADVGARNALLFLLGLCMAARVRRAFEYTEWYQFMLGLPVYVLAAGLLVPGLTFARRRLVRAAVVPALVLSAWCYWSLGVGPLTRGARWETLRTVRGTVRVSPEIARQYQALASVLRRLDPTGRRPLFTFGYASFNYFLGRPNPSSLTTGFRFTDRAPAQIIAGVLEARPRAFVMDNLYFTRGMLPVPELKLDTWRQPLQPSFYRVYDRPFFEALVAACGPEVATIPDRRGRPLFRLYDCRAQGNSAGAANR